MSRKYKSQHVVIDGAVADVVVVCLDTVAESALLWLWVDDIDSGSLVTAFPFAHPVSV